MSEFNHTFETVVYLGSTNITINDMVLRHGSLVDHALSVSPISGHLSLSLPATNNGSHYRLFAFYQYRTLHKNVDFEPTQDITIFDNGSFTVDHFSARGAATVIKFWKKYILDDNMKSLIAKVGNYGMKSCLLPISRLDGSLTVLQLGKTALRLCLISRGPQRCLHDSSVSCNIRWNRSSL